MVTLAACGKGFTSKNFGTTVGSTNGIISMGTTTVSNVSLTGGGVQSLATASRTIYASFYLSDTSQGVSMMIQTPNGLTVSQSGNTTQLLATTLGPMNYEGRCIDAACTQVGVVFQIPAPINKFVSIVSQSGSVPAIYLTDSVSDVSIDDVVQSL